MNYLHDLIYRLRAGESERRIARDLKVSRPTVHKYKLWAEEQGYLVWSNPCGNWPRCWPSWDRCLSRRR